MHPYEKLLVLLYDCKDCWPLERYVRAFINRTVLCDLHGWLEGHWAEHTDKVELADEHKQRDQIEDGVLR
jgi:hypothetical protein